MKKIFVIIRVLCFLAAASCQNAESAVNNTGIKTTNADSTSPPPQIKITDMPGLKDETCTNKYFINAVEKAYDNFQLDSIAIREVKSNNLSVLMKTIKTAVDSVDIIYQQALNKCGNNNVCTDNARTERNESMEAVNQLEEEQLKILNKEEADDMQVALDEFKVAVDTAKDIYCNKYRISGSFQDVIFTSGALCEFSVPFIINGHSKTLGNDFDIKCNPDTDSSGSFSLNFSMGFTSISGGGTYKIENLYTTSAVFKMKGSNDIKALFGSSSGGGTLELNLIKSGKCGD